MVPCSGLHLFSVEISTPGAHRKRIRSRGSRSPSGRRSFKPPLDGLCDVSPCNLNHFVDEGRNAAFPPPDPSHEKFYCRLLAPTIPQLDQSARFTSAAVAWPRLCACWRHVALRRMLAVARPQPPPTSCTCCARMQTLQRAAPTTGTAAISQRVAPGGRATEAWWRDGPEIALR